MLTPEAPRFALMTPWCSDVQHFLSEVLQALHVLSAELQAQEMVLAKARTTVLVEAVLVHDEPQQCTAGRLFPYFLALFLQRLKIPTWTLNIWRSPKACVQESCPTTDNFQHCWIHWHILPSNNAGSMSWEGLHPPCKGDKWLTLLDFWIHDIQLHFWGYLQL